MHHLLGHFRSSSLICCRIAGLQLDALYHLDYITQPTFAGRIRASVTSKDAFVTHLNLPEQVESCLIIFRAGQRGQIDFCHSSYMLYVLSAARLAQSGELEKLLKAAGVL